MSNTENPPLESAKGRPAPTADRHDDGTIVNPPLEHPARGGTAPSDDQNPPLHATGRGAPTSAILHDNPPLSSAAGGTHDHATQPPLEDAEIERWFEAQLGEITSTPVSAAAPRSSARKAAGKKSGTKKSGAKKAAAKKTGAKKAPKRASKRSPAKRASSKKTARD